VDGVRAGIIIEVSVIGIVEEDSAARVGAGIVSDKIGIVKEKSSVARVEASIVGDEVSVVEEESGVRRACAIERGVAVETWCFRDKLSFKNESNKKSKFISDSGFAFFFLLFLLFLLFLPLW
jgi:hypothetical protein